jgi:hypothetical protein
MTTVNVKIVDVCHREPTMMQAVSPPPAPPAEAAQSAQAATGLVTVSQQTENQVVTSNDQPLTLVKAGRREQAVLRYTLFIASTTTVVRPTTPPGPDRLRWSSASYLQRQLCFTSITGLFSCSEAEVIPLPDKSEGEAPAPLPAPEVPATVELQKGVAEPSAADIARSNLSEALRLKAMAEFDEDRRLKVDPLLKAAGVRAQTPRSPRAGRAPEQRKPS